MDVMSNLKQVNGTYEISLKDLVWFDENVQKKYYEISIQSLPYSAIKSTRIQLRRKQGIIVSSIFLICFFLLLLFIIKGFLGLYFPIMLSTSFRINVLLMLYHNVWYLKKVINIYYCLRKLYTHNNFSLTL